MTEWNFKYFSTGDRTPEISIKMDSDKEIIAVYDKKGILSHFTGKLGEYKIIDKFLEFPLDVYLPIIDVRGIDCIIKMFDDRYLEIQIKTRGTTKRGKTIFNINKIQATKNLFIICYRLDLNDFWVLPSEIFIKYSKTNSKGGLRLDLGKGKQKILERYKNNLKILFEK